MRLAVSLVAALLRLAIAQDTTSSPTITSAPTSSAAPSSTGAPLTFTVQVGNNGGFNFVPDVVQVSPGNYVEWDFYPTNHSVIRAEYKYACVPYEDTGVDKIGFYSGQEYVDAILSDPPKYRVLINDTNPIFYYCGAPGSCIQHQMVGVINPNASVSLDVQKAYAANSSFMLLPGESWPSESSEPDPLSTTTVTSGPTSAATSSATTSPTSSPTAAAESHHSSSLSAGAIAGIAIGGAAVLIGAAALIFFCGMKSRRRNSKSSSPSTQPMTAAPAGPPSYPPNYGYASPPNKHASVTSSAAPLTDAFGNPLHPDANNGMYGYPNNHPQGYPPPSMQQNPMGSPQFQNPQPSPASDIFGTQTAPSQAHQSQSYAGSEIPSVRASSPESMSHTHGTGPVSGGIEAFLQRQQGGRMSPALEVDGREGMSHHASPTGEAGPYEMSAARSVSRPGYQHRSSSQGY